MKNINEKGIYKSKYSIGSIIRDKKTKNDFLVVGRDNNKLIVVSYFNALLGVYDLKQINVNRAYYKRTCKNEVLQSILIDIKIQELNKKFENKLVLKK